MNPNRAKVSFKFLSFQEMFGKDALPYEQVSEDEDWGPGKRRRREKESDAVNTLMTMHESENKHPNNEKKDRIRGDSSGIKRPCFRLPHDAVEVLIDNYSAVVSLSCYLSKFHLKIYIIYK
jgi:hypothetical protein